MKILILGAAGMIGQKLTQKLIFGNSRSEDIKYLILHDMVSSEKPETQIPTTVVIGDISKATEAKKLIEMKPDIIFHLASIVSGQAEQEFDKGWLVNTKATWRILDEIRKANLRTKGLYRPKLIFTSSIAVFGPPFPNKITDDFLCAPQTSYGTQKATSEMLVADYSRKGFLNGVSIRLPTICVRPGKPNRAASSFFSGIIREPLNGVEAILPVSTDVRHWHASPRSAAGFLMHSAEIDLDQLGTRRSLNMPGLSCTVDEQIESLRKIAGNDAVSLIKRQRDEKIVKIVEGWPRDFTTHRAISLGFSSEANFDEIIKIYLEDDFKPQ